MPTHHVSASGTKPFIDPCRILPTEVTAEIFERCLPSGPERLDAPLQRLAPLMLTWVCRSWRNLCLSLPILWTELAIGHRRSALEGDARLVELWIARSGNLPISLRLNYEIDDGMRPLLFNEENYRRSLRRLLAPALQCIERWATFEMHSLDISMLDQIFLAIVTRGSPWLKNLSFSTKYFGFFGDVYVIDFSLCPSLRSIRLWTPMISPVSESIVMENMTRLELRFCSSIEDCLHWISICPALEELVVRLFCSDVDEPTVESQRPPSHRPCRLQRMRYLEVHNFSSEVDMGGLLDVLDTPSLTSLTINMYDMIEPSARWTHVLDLLKRSEPYLKTLQVLGTPMTMEDIGKCLSMLPALRKLSVGTRIATDVLLDALSATHNPEEGGDSGRVTLCPMLIALDLVNCSWTADLLASVIATRFEFSSEFTEKPMGEVLLERDNAQRAREHPVIMRSLEQGLRIVEREPDLLRLSFASPDVVFV